MFFRVMRLAALALPVFTLAGNPGSSDRLPFQVGERLTYDAKVNSLNAGKAYLSVEGLESIRGGLVGLERLE